MRDWHASWYQVAPSPDERGYCVIDIKTGETVAGKILTIETARTIAELLSIQWETNDFLERMRRKQRHPAFRRKPDENWDPFA